jgi:hypothetical protein
MMFCLVDIGVFTGVFIGVFIARVVNTPMVNTHA